MTSFFLSGWKSDYKQSGGISKKQPKTDRLHIGECARVKIENVVLLGNSRNRKKGIVERPGNKCQSQIQIPTARKV